MTLESKLADFQKCLDVGPGSAYEEWLHRSLSECLGMLKKCREQRNEALSAEIYNEEDSRNDCAIKDAELLKAIE